MRRAVACAGLVMFVSSNAAGWSGIAPGNPAWRERVPFALNDQGAGGDLDLDTIEREVVRAMTDWTAPACTSLTVSYLGLTTQSPGNANNVIGWKHSGWQSGPGVLGITEPQMSFFPTSAIVGASMWLNGQDHSWVVGAGGFGQLDTYSIVLHEGGHYYGLGHTSVPGSTMVASFPGGVFSLGPDDVEGICALYPLGKLEACPTRPCDAGEACVDGNCLPSSMDVPPEPMPEPTPTPEPPTMPPDPADAPPVEDPSPSDPTTPPPYDPTTSCTIDADCGPERLCMAGACVGDGGMPPLADGPGAGAANSPVGAPCTFDDECESGMCLAHAGGTSCTQACARDADCPAGTFCNALDPLPTCLPVGAPATIVSDASSPRADPSTGGCGLTARPHARAAWLSLALLLPLLLDRRRRRARAGRAREAPAARRREHSDG